ncbi:Membrane Occupation and Recognition Nexus repeat-containing protein, partial [Prunus dulcis]
LPYLLLPIRLPLKPRTMPNQDSPKPTESPLKDQESDPNPDPDEEKENLSSDSESEYDSDESSEYEGEGGGGGGEVDDTLNYIRPGEELPESDNTPDVNMKLFSQVLQGKRVRRRQEEEDRSYRGGLEGAMGDAPLEMTKPGWDPVWADEEEWDIVREEIKAGKDPPIAPFYVPYRRPYPAIPDDHHDISNPKAVIEELDRIEEFLKWVSYVFPDGSSYEGTVWDDLAHGKGVYVAEQGLVRYEGEWLQNNMEGHGVVEVDIPDIEPIPGSKLEAEMRAEGHIISRDYMTPEDKEWLEMDIEDSIRQAGGNMKYPFMKEMTGSHNLGGNRRKVDIVMLDSGSMPECTDVVYMKSTSAPSMFYFGELLEDSTGCDEDVSALHAGIAEVAAAKARMFVNKPDGMVREERGPYSDPQHPYFYEDEDVWMAPGFINQFYEVPDYWKTYVHEVDEEREMWLNSFYKAPLRIPMPAELEYWWSKDETPEFVLINKEPEPDPADPSKLVYTEDPLILHTRTGRLINYIYDEKYGVRLFWQPPLKEGEDVDPKKAQFLPLGFDEFYGKNIGVKKQNFWMRLVSGVENACKPVLDKVEKWTEEKRKASEMKMKLIEKELELIEAELRLEEVIEDMDEELKRREKEEEKVEMGLQKEEDTSALANQDEKPLVEEDEEEEEEEDEDDVAPSSFGSVTADQDATKNGQKGNKPGKSPFSTSSLAFASSSFVSGVPSRLQQSFLSWKDSRPMPKAAISSCSEASSSLLKAVDSVIFPPVVGPKVNLKATRQRHFNFQAKTSSNGRLCRLRPISQICSPHSASMNTRISPKESRSRNHRWPHAAPERESDSILSLHTPSVLF